MPREIGAAEEKAEPGSGAKLYLGNAAVSAIVAAVVSLAGGRQSAPALDESKLVEEVTVRVIRDSESRFISRELVSAQLHAMAEKLDAIERRTSDLPRMAAELSIVQRNLSK